MAIGKFLATWSPFWFLPFGYYLFIAFTLTYLLFYELTNMYTLYQKSIGLGRSEVAEATQNQSISKEKIDSASQQKLAPVDVHSDFSEEGSSEIQRDQESKVGPRICGSCKKIVDHAGTFCGICGNKL